MDKALLFVFTVSFSIVYLLFVICLYATYFDKEANTEKTVHTKWHRTKSKVVNYSYTTSAVTKRQLVIHTLIFIVAAGFSIYLKL